MKKLHAEKTLEERLEDSEGMLKRYPGRCCIYVEKIESCKSLEELPKKRFLIPDNIQVDQFMYIVRKRLSLKKGYRLNNSTFGALTDPMVDGLQNPYSEGYDDNKAIDLFGNNYEMISKDYPTSDYNIYRFIKTDH